MRSKDINMIVGLIKVMWADNEIAEGERELLGGALAKLGCDPEEVFAVGEMIKDPTSVNIFAETLPSMEDRRELIQAMAVMAMADGDFAEVERSVIEKAAAHLQIPAAEVPELIEKACQLLAEQKK